MINRCSRRCDWLSHADIIRCHSIGNCEIDGRLINIKANKQRDGWANLINGIWKRLNANKNHWVEKAGKKQQHQAEGR